MSSRNATMSSGARRHHSPVEACQRLHVGQPVRRSPQWSISTKGWSHCLQRRDGISDNPRFVSKANGGPNARADAGGPNTGPRSAAPKPIEPSGPLGAARASHCIHPDLPHGGDTPDQLNWVMSESGSERASASRINSATAYSNVDGDFSAMAAGSHGDHAPVSIELGRICRRS